jgi:hypothetical protein
MGSGTPLAGPFDQGGSGLISGESLRLGTDRSKQNSFGAFLQDAGHVGQRDRSLDYRQIVGLLQFGEKRRQTEAVIDERLVALGRIDPGREIMASSSRRTKSKGCSDAMPTSALVEFFDGRLAAPARWFRVLPAWRRLRRRRLAMHRLPH